MLIIAIVFLVLSLSSCESHTEGPDSVAGSEEDTEKILVGPDWAKIFPPKPGTSNTVTTPSTTGTTTTSTHSKTDECDYNGRYNGDRPTWYCPKKMSAYPGGSRVIVDGCYDVVVSDTSKRYEKNGLILKQSDVSGRGAAIVAASSCKATTARVKY